MSELLDIFRALADPTRLRVVALLREMELAIGELAVVLDQSQPRVSRHVRILVEAGIVERRREGSWVFLRIAEGGAVAGIIGQAEKWPFSARETRVIAYDARRLAAVRMITCASPDYLAGAGTPMTLEDVAKHEAILDTNARDATVWRFGRKGDAQEVRVHGRLKFNGAEACVEAAVKGFGIVRTPAFAAAEELRAGRLIPILCNFEPEEIYVHAVYPHARHLAAKVRAFVDFLAKRYAGEPEWHQGWGQLHPPAA